MKTTIWLLTFAVTVLVNAGCASTGEDHIQRSERSVKPRPISPDNEYYYGNKKK